MKEIVAYLLAKLGGNEDPQKDDVIKILDSVGIKAEESKMDTFFADLKKLNISVEAAIAAGTEKLAVVGTGGGGGGGGGAGAGGDATADAGGAAAAEEEEESESEKSSSAAGGGLFGDDGSSSDESSS